MDGATWVGAAVSVSAAGVAWWGAERARKSADSIDRRRHRLEALDAETASFRGAHQDFMSALAEAGHGESTLARIGTVGRLLTTGEILGTHPRATDEVRSAVDHLTSVLSLLVSPTGPPPADEFARGMAALREAVMSVYASCAAQRAAIVEHQ